ncbi:MAG: sel1 repeat family protein [Alphaproteobacteria bacterium]|nr:sel1 repeat family protein [Alphaproteobacteria bacterium]
MSHIQPIHSASIDNPVYGPHDIPDAELIQRVHDIIDIDITPEMIDLYKRETSSLDEFDFSLLLHSLYCSIDTRRAAIYIALKMLKNDSFYSHFLIMYLCETSIFEKHIQTTIPPKHPEVRRMLAISYLIEKGFPQFTELFIKYLHHLPLLEIFDLAMRGHQAYQTLIQHIAQVKLPCKDVMDANNMNDFKKMKARFNHLNFCKGTNLDQNPDYLSFIGNIPLLKSLADQGNPRACLHLIQSGEFSERYLITAIEGGELEAIIYVIKDSNPVLPSIDQAIKDLIGYTNPTSWVTCTRENLRDNTHLLRNARHFYVMSTNIDSSDIIEYPQFKHPIHLEREAFIYASLAQDTNATCILANIYTNGRVVQRNMVKALDLHCEVARKADQELSYQFAKSFYDVEKNFTKAEIALFDEERLAAAGAYFLLGVMFLKNPDSRDKAIDYLKLASKGAFFPIAMRHLLRCAPDKEAFADLLESIIRDVPDHEMKTFVNHYSTAIYSLDNRETPATSYFKHRHQQLREPYSTAVIDAARRGNFQAIRDFRAWASKAISDNYLLPNYRQALDTAYVAFFQYCKENVSGLLALQEILADLAAEPIFLNCTKNLINEILEAAKKGNLRALQQVFHAPNPHQKELLRAFLIDKSIDLPAIVRQIPPSFRSQLEKREVELTPRESKLRALLSFFIGLIYAASAEIRETRVYLECALKSPMIFEKGAWQLVPLYLSSPIEMLGGNACYLLGNHFIEIKAIDKAIPYLETSYKEHDNKNVLPQLIEYYSIVPHQNLIKAKQYLIDFLKEEYTCASYNQKHLKVILNDAIILSLIREYIEEGNIDALYYAGAYGETYSPKLWTSFETRCEYLKQAAIKGHPTALTALKAERDKAPENKKHIPQLAIAEYKLVKHASNPYIALACLRIAIKLGSPQAAFMLGEAYVRGCFIITGPQIDFKQVIDFAPDRNLAKDHLNILVFNGDAPIHLRAEAYYYLGDLAYTETEKRRDFQIAFEYFTRADHIGSPRGTFSLGICYYNGDGVLPDQNRGYVLIKSAAERGVRRARKWLKHKARHENSLQAQLDIGQIYANKKRFDDALFFLNLAADQDSIRAHLQIASLYEGPLNNQQKAMACFERAADLSHTPSMERVAQFYFEHPNPNIQNYHKAYLQYRFLSYNPTKPAEYSYRMGRILFEGLGHIFNGIPRYFDALPAFKRAAKRGHAGAQFMVGRMYHEGLGTNVNREKAIRYLRLAADQNHPEAEALLHRLTVAPLLRQI